VDGDDSNTGDITTLDVVLFFQPSKATYHSFFRRSVEHRFVGACHGFTKERMLVGNCVMAAVVVTAHWQRQEYYYQYAFEATPRMDLLEKGINSYV
jgi:hypothetical protein